MKRGLHQRDMHELNRKIDSIYNQKKELDIVLHRLQSKKKELNVKRQGNIMFSVSVSKTIPINLSQLRSVLKPYHKQLELSRGNVSFKYMYQPDTPTHCN